MEPLICAIAAVAAIAVVLLACTRSRAAEHSAAYTHHLSTPEWRARARRCLEFTHRRCCLVPWRRAVEAHHLQYGNLGHERTVRDLVPLSALGHRIAHAWFVWRGPLRLPMTWMLRCATVVVGVCVRPWLLGAVGTVVVAVSAWIYLFVLPMRLPQQIVEQALVSFEAAKQAIVRPCRQTDQP